MKNTFGNNITLTLFGESHGEKIGVVIDGLSAGIPIDEQFIVSQMNLRKAVGLISTPRKEDDKVAIVSGIFNGFTTGAPICLEITNDNINSKDYEKLRFTPRPSHADYTAQVKYSGFQDYRGGGHFSGRLTAPLVGAGAIFLSALKTKNIYIGSHILSCKDCKDKDFSSNILSEIFAVNKKEFATIDDNVGKKMIQEIVEAKKQGDSLGGIIQTGIVNLPAGIGEPFFDSVEAVLAHLIFSIPAVKGIEFGKGFAFSKYYGSEVNDQFAYKDDKVVTLSNNNAGINGGISNGMPIIFNTVIKPTPSISKTQKTINLEIHQDCELSIMGRHDPAIFHRARVVIDSLTAFGICDLLMTRFGEDYFR